ncbi:MAG: carotenoid biosynthesis protein [Myxococcaceae bacterium]|jgi:ceramide glucosyltransferase|nr:carotenoid biosynthesis protein [Myxococcaceae bacterium]MCA3016273.1 carotenoid biosynthesis protein [Myxococcaceae bacterium]
MSTFVAVWAIVAGLFSAVAVYRLRVWRRPAPSARVRRRPRVLLIRPVDAPTPLELENLATPIDYPGELTHVVVSPFRPRLASANVRWLASDPLTRNRKVGHIAYALASLDTGAQGPREETPDERPDALTGTLDQVVLCVDADVRVDAALVTALVDELAAGAAAASAAPRPDVSESFGGRCVRGLLVQSHHAFEVLDVMSAGAPAICGKALALSPRAAAELVKLGDCIGEDLELAAVLHEQGQPVALARAVARVPQADAVAVSAVVERFTRWMQVLRAHRGALFPSVPLLFAPTPALMVLASVVATPGVAIALCFLVAARITLANTQDGRGGLRFEWLMAEVLLWAAWLNALRQGSTVQWRGRRFALKAGGRMEALPSSGEAS